ncbi:hypothetical protein BKG71_19460 [Mycobacteroides chelonae]|nr:hypothetical protein BKG71_19460 [Mycobacteroides chelonae]
MSSYYTKPDCGGCKGLGSHSSRCLTQPGAMFRRLADDAESLGDHIGSNDTEAANLAYTIAARMRDRWTQASQ